MIINSLWTKQSPHNSPLPLIQSSAKLGLGSVCANLPVLNSMGESSKSANQVELLLNAALKRETSSIEPLKVLETHLQRGLKRIINLKNTEGAVESLSEQVSNRELDVRRNYTAQSPRPSSVKATLNEIQSQASDIFLSKEEIYSSNNYLKETREYSLDSNQKLYLKSQDIADGMIKINYSRHPSGDSKTIEINSDKGLEVYTLKFRDGEAELKNILHNSQYHLSVESPETLEIVNIPDIKLKDGARASFASAGELSIYKNEELLTKYSSKGDRIDYTPSDEKIFSLILADGSLIKVNNDLPTQKIKANTTVINYDVNNNSLQKIFFSGPGLRYGAYNENGTIEFNSSVKPHSP